MNPSSLRGVYSQCQWIMPEASGLLITSLMYVVWSASAMMSTGVLGSLWFVFSIMAGVAAEARVMLFFES